MQILIIANKYNNFYPALKTSIHRDYAQMAVCFHVELSTVSILIEFMPAASLNSTRAHIKYLIYRRAHAKQPTYIIFQLTLSPSFKSPDYIYNKVWCSFTSEAHYSVFPGKAKRQTQPSSS